MSGLIGIHSASGPWLKEEKPWKRIGPKNDYGEKQQGKIISVLLVDDESMVLKAVARGLKDDRFTISTATNGAEALNVIQKCPIDVVISDFHMPVMGGLELLRNIRKSEPRLKVIIASGAATENDIEALYSAGASAVLNKPVSLANLKKAVETVLGNPRARIIERGEGLEIKTCRLLIVDDNQALREITKDVMEECGFMVKTAENGLDAYAEYSAGGVDVIVSDLHMPEMDGLELLRLIKQGRPQSRVIILSGGATPEEREQLKAEGAFEVLSKPTDANALVDSIQRALSG
jgi:CheY-like chemotaxis protein